MFLQTILGMSVTRFITIYIAQGTLFAFLSYLAYKILKRDTKRLNLIFSGFYISAATAIFVNFIYGPLNDLDMIYTLNFITNFGLAFASIFLLVFNLILLKSEKIITTSKQLTIIIGFGALMFIMVFFPRDSPTMGIYFSEPQAPPVWSLPYYLYVTIITTIGSVIPTFYYAVKIYKKFEDDMLKQRWKYFLIGIICIYTFCYLIFAANFLNIPSFRLIMGIIGIILGLSGGYLMYYGVGRQIQK